MTIYCEDCCRRIPRSVVADPRPAAHVCACLPPGRIHSCPGSVGRLGDVALAVVRAAQALVLASDDLWDLPADAPAEDDHPAIADPPAWVGECAAW